MIVALVINVADVTVADEVATAGPSLASLVSGKLKIVDLTHALNERNAHWPGENYEPFRLRTIATLEKDGVLSKAFCMPEHLGTHMDAPNHFERNQPSVDQLSPERLMAEGAVIDISPQAAADPDYRLTVDDVGKWEATNGRLNARTVVMLRTGWARFWNEPSRYKNQDVRGRMHFPGYSVGAARFLVEQREVRGIGIDTMSIDYGASRDFAVHHLVNRSGRYGLENVANLDRLPARGFYLIVAPIKIEGGTGGPTRLFAIVP